jgi:uncharacterized protein (DUF3084 family)
MSHRFRHRPTTRRLCADAERLRTQAEQLIAESKRLAAQSQRLQAESIELLQGCTEPAEEGVDRLPAPADVAN